MIHDILRRARIDVEAEIDIWRVKSERTEAALKDAEAVVAKLTAQLKEAHEALVSAVRQLVDAEARAAGISPETAKLYAQAAHDVVVAGTVLQDK